MTHTKRHRKHGSRRHRKYGHRGGYSSLSPATYSASSSPSTQTTTTASNNAMQPPYNAMGPVSSSTNLGSFFSSGAIDQKNINQHIMATAKNNQNLIEQAGGDPMDVMQKGGVWNKMIGDAIAPLVLLGLQQYYGPRNKSGMNKKMRKGKMTKRYRK